MSVFLTFLNKKPPRKDGIPWFPVWVTARNISRPPSPSSRVCTDGRTKDVRSYADAITKFSRLDGLPIFLTHGASLARFARRSFAIINWHLSKQSIRWPVLRGYIAGSSLELIEVTCFFKLTADHDWIAGSCQVNLLKTEQDCANAGLTIKS